MKERTGFPLYPLAAAAFPVISVYSANLAYVPATDLIRPLAVTILGTVVGWLVLSLVTRSVARGAAGATVLVLCFFVYAWIVERWPRDASSIGLTPLAGWLAATVALTALAVLKGSATRVMNVLAAFVTVTATGNLALNLKRAESVGAGSSRSALASTVPVERPDIFYIILDGYGRSDAVRRAIGFSNDAFVESLRSRGFLVADRSHSNYCQTELSLASSLNMDFISNLLPKISPEEVERKPLGDLIDQNEVARRLRAKGYQFVAVTSGFPPVSFNSADFKLEDRSGSTMVESSLLNMTPFASGPDEIESQFEVRRKTLLTTFDNLASLARPTPAPRFVVTHILAPHPPFVFGPNGEQVPHEGQYGFWDGSDYMSFVATPAEYRKRWAGQAEFVGNKVLASLDRLLARPGPRPIIVIQGDHGSKVGLDQNDLAKTDVSECFPILNAYLVPDAVKSELTPDITPVNTFRTLLRTLFGDDLPPLPNRSWYSRFATPYAFTEVTDRIEPALKKHELK